MKTRNIKIILLIFFIIILLSVAYYRFFAINKKEATPAEVINIQTQIQNLPLSGEIINGKRVIKVIANQYSFIPDPIVINKGENVNLIVESVDVAHGFAVTAFNIFEDDIIPGEPREIEFKAASKGSFEIVCSTYCGSGHKKMTAKIIVK